MKLKAALQVFNQSRVQTSPGVIEGLTIRKLAGSAEHPSERINVGLATFGPGTHEHLHWHLIETFHYIVAGRGIVRDLEGNSYDVGPGDVVYGPPGIRGAHEWEVQETLQLLTIKATNAPERAIQFSIDRATMESKADFDYLIERGAGDLKESFY
ncbi:MAG: cupin domain-containing protein [Betaproteobacteria bacterium]|nr:cupin domain-containing protein [Betaproteobacteria bacterium]